jgi:phenylacetic acid degradation operon negative regulatory protein
VTEPGLPLLPARSVLLSVLLGSHPPHLSVRTLVRSAELFGIADGTVRVALSRLAADGEVEADGGSYRLSERHLERQRDQDAGLRPAKRPWRGAWVLAVLRNEPEDRPAPAPAGVRREMDRSRMAELRPGAWTRPDNLARPAFRPAPDLLVWTGRPDGSGPAPAELAARLWDLDGWSRGAESLLDRLAAATEAVERLTVAAAMVRHLRSDPVLPPALLPPGWPGRRLRRAYDAYRVELGRLIAGTAAS